ncbi:hypothetical protein V7079_23350 [Priestia megaterium]|uniref:hypothetical protein n=2 Tax=Priestia megaterium TaxID=1404 RepID=UPI000BF571CF|nr:hypothetical protein [Priestia megaterium]PFK01985.1 hypothetical protein COI96_06225 [Priestia megaterium]PMD08148.1 hypothetical protein CJ194_19305 [Priestia megaterium]
MKCVHTIRFSDFMDRNYKEVVQKKKPTKTYSLYINPLVFLDPTVCIIGGGILGLALVEKFLIHQGNIDIAMVIQSIISILFPLLAVGSLIYVLTHLPLVGWL